MNQVIISQLEKALKCKDDKELRLRVEVLVDMLKEQAPPVPQLPIAPQLPATPQVTYEAPAPTGEIPKAYVVPKNMKEPRINGTGPIVSNGEQVQYVRPKGT